ncbi:MobH family relaxase [Paracidovorax citrulli]|uniref:Relaxase n=2 Tax=Paracidovorax citrulli TaxID=80869 RepID=A1TJN5_PARC0|nr:MobH family relaxase [Paracidovorax citrulli]ABM31173.1 Relaxase [Paracidovorax citrulli AAC00-1]ATG95690.1 relaxase [Paracidovorax citrulli]PVY65358.1 integrating conjugative element relaxase (TIGR03760 family) [Paracidovorax citrulli]REG70460.1 integrating conjugative element relaxase (TIGR03760 family) [Paracidovorax citrulli]RLJ95012.1 integrating conjugative element relaxase (TIGR03760 family) [Paracidovorax citrulli]
MFRLFRRAAGAASTTERTPANAPPVAATTPSLPGWTARQSASELLAPARRQRLLEHIWQRTSLSRAQFDQLYLGPIRRYAEFVQSFPASESHHHAYPGGMLDHGLEIVAYALKLRQSHLLPAGATPEAQAAQAEAWTAGVAYAALLHDIGKIAVDLEVELDDGSRWNAWHGVLRRPYRFRYRRGREYRLHGAASGLLYLQILDRAILDWLSGYPDLWRPLLYVLAGQHEHAGVLGELVVQADQASVAQAMGGDPARALAAPRHALQRKLLDGLRFLLREQLQLNQPQASDGWLTQDALWLVSKTVSDKLRAHLLSQGMEGIPSSNTAVFDVLQEHGIALPAPDGKAIWRACVTSESGWSNTFTFLRLSPALIWDAGERPAPFSGTVKEVAQDAEAAHASPIAPQSAATMRLDTAGTTPGQGSPAPQQDGIGALLDLLQLDSSAGHQASPDAAIAPQPVQPGDGAGGEAEAAALHEADAPANAASGHGFVDWLRLGLQQRRLVLNDAKALVHTVADTAYLVSPGVFQRYAQEHPEVRALAKGEQLADWQWVQKQFERLRLHRKQANGLNIWTCEVAGPRKTRRLHGYLLRDPLAVLPEALPNNPYLRLLDLNEPEPSPHSTPAE